MNIREKIDAALETLRAGLNPYVAQHLEAAYRTGWVQRAKQSLRDGSTFTTNRSGNPRFDITALCSILLDNWDDVFGQSLGRSEKKLILHIRDIRNDHAHQNEITLDRGIGALDEIETLLNSIGAGTEAQAVRKAKEEVGQARYGTATKLEPPKLIQAPIEERALVPWRDVIVPHPDVQSRRFVNAEFAADLYQVWVGEASEEYADPEQFFARTYLTSGLRTLIENAANRLSNNGGDPIVELQTSFGGGKTHALLSLFHLVGASDKKKLLGIPELLAGIGVNEVPKAHRAVLVGTKLMAGQPSVKGDGTVVNTLWGELAYQLGGAEGYAIVAEADRTSTSPGAALDELLKRYSPCLILVDEWVAYARQLLDDAALCGGSFATQFTFAQALTESVTATKGALLVVSLPVSEDNREGSDIEVGGIRGREALRRLRNVLARKQSNWQPADAAESYAIVRRRLFENIEPDKAKLRDKAVDRLHKYYRDKESLFPTFASKPEYKQKLAECYPIHPELFERLYNEWGSLEQFQRTRGVLRLMAAVIHCLWAAGDRHPLIMPGLLPIEDQNVVGDLVRYLGDPWRAVLARDVIGKDSRAARIDEQHANLGRYSAARRVARAIFLATAPQNAEGRGEVRNAGIDARSIRLACAFPDDNLSAFDNATRRLIDEATHLTTDDVRYWFQLSPNLNRRAQDEASAYERYEIHEEIVRRLQRFQNERGDFVRVHTAPANSGEVPEERNARLVVLGPNYTHKARQQSTEALKFSLECTLKIGEGNRVFKNALVYLAPDESRLEQLELSIRQALAWKKIADNQQQYELTPSQQEMARQKAAQCDGDAVRALNQCWCHALVPTQNVTPGSPIELDEHKIDGGDSPALATSEKLRRDGLLNPTLGGTNLRSDLDSRGIWGENGSIQIGRLFDMFAQYPYMRRLKNEGALRDGIQGGLVRLTWDTDTFAYAENYDDARKRFVGLVAGPDAALVAIDMTNGLLVRADVASAQLEAEQAATAALVMGSGGNGAPGGGDTGTICVAVEQPQASGPPKHFFLRVKADDVTKLPRVATQLANDIVAHLASIGGASVEVSIEVKADISNGINAQLEDRLRKNAAAHQFPDPEFNQ